MKDKVKRRKRLQTGVLSLFLAALMVLSSAASAFAAGEPYIEIVKKISGGSTKAEIYIKQLEKEAAGVQFELKVEKPEAHGAISFSDTLKSYYTHYRADGNQITFYVTSNGLPADKDGSLHVAVIPFSGTDAAFSAANLKTVDQDANLLHELSAVSVTVTEERTSSSGGKNNSSKNDVKEPEQPEKEVTDPGAAAGTFSDVKGHWAESFISYNIKNGLMSGMGNGQFAPEGTVTRAMLVQTIFNIESKTSGSALNLGTAQSTGSALNPGATHSAGKALTEKTFSDVSQDQWYGKAVSWAASNGVVSGTSADQFSPEQPVTRQEMAVMFMNYGKYRELNMPQTGKEAAFLDRGTISSWADASVSEAVKAGLLNGRPDGSFDPYGNATRAEIAVVLEGWMEKIN